MAELTEATAVRLADETTALRGDVAGLSTAIRELRERLDGSEERQRAAEQQARRTRIGLAVLAALVTAILFIAWQNYRTNVDQETTAAQLAQITREYICPSTALLVGGYRPDSRPAGEARDAYAESIAALRDARERLACADALVPPALPPSVAPAPAEPSESPVPTTTRRPR